MKPDLLFPIFIILVILLFASATLYLPRLHLQNDNTHLSESAPIRSPQESCLSERLSTPESFYQTIIDNNLFRPHGWHPPVRQSQYELIGTLMGTLNENAFILDKHSNKVLTLTVGEKIGEVVLNEISPKRIKLTENGQRKFLTLRSPLIVSNFILQLWGK